MLRHKALIQAFRTAFGFAGVYEEDEAQRIIEAKVIDTTPMIEGTPEAPDTSAFDRLAADVADDPQWLKFLDETARANGITVDALKVEASRDFEQFAGMFRAWAAKQEPTKPSPRRGAEARVAAAASAASVQPEPSAESQAETPGPQPNILCPRQTAAEGEPVHVLESACEKCAERGQCESWKE